jgi:hypothetical protein
MFNEEINFNITFHGSYDLLIWIIKRYKKELPYNGEIRQFVLQNNYTEYCSTSWKHNGVNPRVWNSLNKDLIMAFLLNKIQMVSLYDLKNEFNLIKKK